MRYGAENTLNQKTLQIITRQYKEHRSPPQTSIDRFRQMEVPFLDLKAQLPQILPEIEERIKDIIANTGFILGKYVSEFEEAFAKAHDVNFCIGVSSGTDALHVALVSLGIGPGDRVIVPVNTFIATAEAVSLTGAAPVFVDCDEYYKLDVEIA